MKGPTALRRLRRNFRAGRGRTDPLQREGFDGWLDQRYGLLLAGIEARSHGEGDLRSLFREVHDDDLWTVLLWKRYSGYPGIRAVLPNLPNPALQAQVVGHSGMSLARESRDVYVTLRGVYERHGSKPLDQSTLLDFGCGWGRLLRFFAKDLAAERLFGCDSDPYLVGLCEGLGVRAAVTTSDPVPDSLPFSGPFDLVYSYSVFTHLSERAHLACIETIASSMAPGGILVVTVRPPGFIPGAAGLGARLRRRRATEGRSTEYSFTPADAPPIDGEVPYGDAVIPIGYIERHWTSMFTIHETEPLLGDPDQVMVVLRKL